MKTLKVTKEVDRIQHLTTNRVINTWNSLPNSVVHAESTDMFKKRLVKFFE